MRIQSQRYDVVYIWTRFCPHSSQNIIRRRCAESNTRLEFLSSLSAVRLRGKAASSGETDDM